VKLLGHIVFWLFIGFAALAGTVVFLTDVTLRLGDRWSRR
jgi:hypothetical protein